MPTEIEAKVRVESPETFRGRVAEAGGVAGETVLEFNRLFDDAARTLRRRGAALRLREEREPATGDLRRAVLTFKGPQAESKLKVRPESETEIASAEAMAEILEGIGLAVTFTYEKRRTVWQVGDCEVTLDELPYLGWFAEIEGPSEKAVRKTLAALGLKGRETITDSYVALLAEQLAESGGSEATFKSNGG